MQPAWHVGPGCAQETSQAPEMICRGRQAGAASQATFPAWKPVPKTGLAAGAKSPVLG